LDQESGPQVVAYVPAIQTHLTGIDHDLKPSLMPVDKLLDKLNAWSAPSGFRRVEDVQKAIAAGHRVLDGLLYGPIELPQ
jgi:hypothetical protein